MAIGTEAESQILKVSKKKKMPQRGNILVAPRFTRGTKKSKYSFGGIFAISAKMMTKRNVKI